MGALLFMGLMFLLLCIGGSFLVLGLIFLFLRHRSKKKGRPKRYLTIITGVFFTLGAVICTLPVGYWLFLRSANSSMFRDYIDTGRMVEGGYQKGAFTVDGVTYEPLDVGYSSMTPKGEAVFSWDVSSGWDRFFGYYNRGNYFAVENTPNLDIIRDDGINRRLWCRSDQLAYAQMWYGDDAHYQWYLHDYNEEGEGVYTLLSPQPDREQIAALRAFQLAEQQAVEFTVPIGSKMQEYSMVSISTDMVANRDWISLVVYDGHLCLAEAWKQSHTDSTRTYTVYPLPVDIAEYFSSLLL